MQQHVWGFMRFELLPPDMFIKMENNLTTSLVYCVIIVYEDDTAQL